MSFFLMKKRDYTSRTAEIQKPSTQSRVWQTHSGGPVYACRETFSTYMLCQEPKLRTQGAKFMKTSS